MDEVLTALENLPGAIISLTFDGRYWEVFGSVKIADQTWGESRSIKRPASPAEILAAAYDVIDKLERKKEECNRGK